MLVFVGTMVIAAAAKVEVPLWPVPMTMLTFAVLLIGAVYGTRLGTSTVLLYLDEGAAGLSVFTGTPERGIDLTYMAGPTGGYLVGFIAAAASVGHLAERGWDKHVGCMGLAMVAGVLVIYGSGVAWLTWLIGFEKAIEFGLVPFLVGDALKITLAATMVPLLWRFVPQRIRFDRSIRSP